VASSETHSYTFGRLKIPIVSRDIEALLIAMATVFARDQWLDVMTAFAMRPVHIRENSLEWHFSIIKFSFTSDYSCLFDPCQLATSGSPLLPLGCPLKLL